MTELELNQMAHETMRADVGKDVQVNRSVVANVYIDNFNPEYRHMRTLNVRENFPNRRSIRRRRFACCCASLLSPSVLDLASAGAARVPLMVSSRSSFLACTCSNNACEAQCQTSHDSGLCVATGQAACEPAGSAGRLDEMTSMCPRQPTSPRRSKLSHTERSVR